MGQYVWIVFALFGLLAVPSLASQSSDYITLQKLSQSMPALLNIWFVDSEICQWQGVTCWKGRVAQIRLRSMHLEGEIPLGFFGQLPYLDFIDLGNNRITGCIPSDIGDSSLLKHVDMSHNLLTGKIPQSLTSLHYLRHFDISYNKIRGALPGFFFPFLGVFKVTSNLLVGRIPRCFSQQPTHYFVLNFLCDKPLPPCPSISRWHNFVHTITQNYVAVRIPVVLILVLVMAVGLYFFYKLHIPKKPVFNVFQRRCYPTLDGHLVETAEVRITIEKVLHSPPGSPLSPSFAPSAQLKLDQSILWEPSPGNQHSSSDLTNCSLVQRQLLLGKVKKSSSVQSLPRFFESPNIKYPPGTAPPPFKGKGKCMPFQASDAVPLLRLHED